MNRQDEIRKLSLDRMINGVDIHLQKDSYIACNTLNLDLSSELSLYRIIGYDRLLESLKDGQLSMSRFCSFEDKNEAFILNSDIRDSNGNHVDLEEEKNKYYVQCWSKCEESNALWKIYTMNKDNKTVKIKASAKKLITVLYNIENPLHHNSYFIGGVKYESNEYIKKLQKELLSNFLFDEGMSLTRTFFIKEMPYDYEHEVRLVYKATTDWNNEPYFYFPIDFNDLIDEIVLHPKLSDDDCQKMTAEIIGLGYRGKVSKSDLYTKFNSVSVF